MLIYQCNSCQGQFKGNLIQRKCIYCNSTDIDRADKPKVIEEENEKSLKKKTKK